MLDVKEAQSAKEIRDVVRDVLADVIEEFSTTADEVLSESPAQKEDKKPEPTEESKKEEKKEEEKKEDEKKDKDEDEDKTSVVSSEQDVASTDVPIEGAPENAGEQTVSAVPKVEVLNNNQNIGQIGTAPLVNNVPETQDINQTMGSADAQPNVNIQSPRSATQTQISTPADTAATPVTDVNAANSGQMNTFGTSIVYSMNEDGTFNVTFEKNGVTRVSVLPSLMTSDLLPELEDFLVEAMTGCAAPASSSAPTLTDAASSAVCDPVTDPNCAAPVDSALPVETTDPTAAPVSDPITDDLSGDEQTLSDLSSVAPLPEDNAFGDSNTDAANAAPLTPATTVEDGVTPVPTDEDDSTMVSSTVTDTASLEDEIEAAKAHLKALEDKKANSANVTEKECACCANTSAVEACDASDSVLPRATMASLRKKYANQVMEIFKLGLMAKSAIIAESKDKFFAKNKEEYEKKGKILAAELDKKKKGLTALTKEYLNIRAERDSIKNLVAVISSSIQKSQKALADGHLTDSNSEKISDVMSAIIAKVVDAYGKPNFNAVVANSIEHSRKVRYLISSEIAQNKKNALIASASAAKKDKEKNAVIASKQENGEIKSERTTAKEYIRKNGLLNRKPGMRNTNVVVESNYVGRASDTVGRINRHDGMDEMIGEIASLI